jgi:hemoglobin
MYPRGDLKNASRKLALFLMQYFGGPTTYSDERGHPRLRQRHFPFVIDRRARDAWMGHMRTAVFSAALPMDVQSEILDYLEGAATFLINQQEPLQLR